MKSSSAQAHYQQAQGTQPRFPGLWLNEDAQALLGHLTDNGQKLPLCWDDSTLSGPDGE